MSGPRFLYNSTVPRLGVELPLRHWAGANCEKIIYLPL